MSRFDDDFVRRSANLALTVLVTYQLQVAWLPPSVAGLVMVLTGLPEFEPEVVLAALIVFRIFYFLIPLVMGLVMVALFERAQLRAQEDQAEDQADA